MNWSPWPHRAPDTSIRATLSGDGRHLLNRVPYLQSAESTAQLETTNTLAHSTSSSTGTSNVDLNEPVGWADWPIDADRHTAAIEQARPYTGTNDTAESTWSARVDAAVNGMDSVDRAGMDAWMQAHATSRYPHLYEARLVAAWETHQHQADQATDADGWG